MLIREYILLVFSLNKICGNYKFIKKYRKKNAIFRYLFDDLLLFAMYLPNICD